MDDDSRHDTGAARGRATADRSGAVIDVVETPKIRTDAATAARVDAWLLGAASTDRRAHAPSRTSSGHRRRTQVVAAAAVVAVAGVVVALATRDADPRPTSANGAGKPVTGAGGASIATTSSAPSSNIATSAAAPASTASTAPATTPATTAPTTTPTTSATVTPTTVTPATTTTVTPTTVTPPAPLSEAQLFQALVDGSYPSGVAWPQAALVDGNIVLSGTVPDDASAQQVRRTMAFAPVAVIDKLTIDPSVPAPAAVLYTVDPDPVFLEGTNDLVVLPEDERLTRLDRIVGLWAKRLGEKPAAKALVVVARDSTGDTVALSRADAVRLRFRVTDDALRQVTIAIAPSPLSPTAIAPPGASGARQVAFALAIVP